jgi:hypothetical protein
MAAVLVVEKLVTLRGMGNPTTARTWASNCDVTQASMV